MLSTVGANLSLEEIQTLALAKEANGPWFIALLRAAQIQADRRAKYSGEGDPYTNFYIVSEYQGKPTEDIFELYQDIKMARIKVQAGDFSDESLNDTLIDMANYCLLEVGFRCRNSKSNAQEQDLQTTFLPPTA
jgi:hypothetical protein